MKILNNNPTTGKWLPKLAVLPFAACVLTACGGGPAYEDDLGMPGSRTSPSVTVNKGRSTAYGDFNPDIWNEHRWYECDCSRDPSKPVDG